MDGGIGILSCIRTGRVPGGLGRMDGTGQNYSVSTEARTVESVFHRILEQGKYPVKNYSVSTEAWTAEPVFHPVIE